jgi:acyl carrier protein
LNDMHARIQAIARDAFDDDGLVLADSTSADEVPNWDSLAHVNFVYSLEEEFGVQFDEEEFVAFANIGELKQLLAAKVPA